MSVGATVGVMPSTVAVGDGGRVAVDGTDVSLAATATGLGLASITDPKADRPNSRLAPTARKTNASTATPIQMIFMFLLPPVTVAGVSSPAIVVRGRVNVGSVTTPSLPKAALFMAFASSIMVA